MAIKLDSLAPIQQRLDIANPELSGLM